MMNFLLKMQVSYGGTKMLSNDLLELFEDYFEDHGIEVVEIPEVYNV